MSHIVLNISVKLGSFDILTPLHKALYHLLSLFFRLKPIQTFPKVCFCKVKSNSIKMLNDPTSTIDWRAWVEVSSVKSATLGLSHISSPMKDLSIVKDGISRLEPDSDRTRHLLTRPIHRAFFWCASATVWPRNDKETFIWVQCSSPPETKADVDQINSDMINEETKGMIITGSTECLDESLDDHPKVLSHLLHSLKPWSNPDANPNQTSVRVVRRVGYEGPSWSVECPWGLKPERGEEERSKVQERMFERVGDAWCAVWWILDKVIKHQSCMYTFSLVFDWMTSCHLPELPKRLDNHLSKVGIVCLPFAWEKSIVSFWYVWSCTVIEDEIDLLELPIWMSSLMSDLIGWSSQLF